MKKIIILYSTGGMGHKKAALAVQKVFDDMNRDDLDIKIVDVLEYGNKTYKFLYLDFYVFLMTRARWLWGILYYLSNTDLVDRLTRKLRGDLDYASLEGLGDMLTDEDPDAIVATHYLLPSIARILKEKKGLSSKMYTVVTDYGPHTYWLSDYIDRFFVGADPVKREMEKRGVPEDRLTVSGIPTTEEFGHHFDVDKLRELYGLDPDRKTVFLMSGGFGVGPMAEMLGALNACEAPIQVITVCGHNKAVYENISVLKDSLNYPVILFGFTDKVAELMAASDLMITKAGGISVTEALNSRLPMILFASVPGQETWNEQFLSSAGAAEKAKDINDISILANRILGSGDKYDAMISGIDSIRRPDAARTIVETVLNDIE